MNVALVHDYLSQDGGAERVLDCLQEIWPEAPLYTLFHDREEAHPRFLNRDIRTTFLQKLPGIKRRYQWYLPLMPLATETYDLSKYDVIISSTSAFAKGIITSPGQLHICYCHTPTRYLWSDTASYIQELQYPFIVKKVLPSYLSKLRIWDKQAADRVGLFIANSKTVQNRISTYYGRESHVIYPPVDVHLFDQKKKNKKEYFLIGGRLVSYKRYDIAIQACSRLGLPLIVFGDGPAKSELERIASPSIKFVGKINDLQKAELYKNAKAFLHPQNEDFGITPVEAMSAGTPVIAYRKDGACETVIEGKTGLFFNKQNWEALAHTILEFEKQHFDETIIRSHAQKFSRHRFKVELRDYTEKAYYKKL